MSTTSALDLLARADQLTRELRRTTAPVTAEQWRTFDATVHRLLLEIAGLNAFHVRPGDPSRSAMVLALRSYPQPLQPPPGTTLTPAQAAPFLNRRPDTVRQLVRDGELAGTLENGTYQINSRELRHGHDIRPADPTDPSPLARVSCALGALADLLHESRAAGEAILDHRGEVAGATIHVLSLAAVAARHTLAHGPLDEVDRPVQIARYAEHAIDSLRNVALRPASLGDVLAISTEPRSTDVIDRLDVALHQWQRVTQQELDRMIPSIDVIRQIANQGAHLCAVTGLLTATTVREATAAEVDRPSLRDVQQALRRGERAWDHLSTLIRPAHEFVTASRALYESLRNVGAQLQSEDKHLDHARAARSLQRGMQDIARLMERTRPLPQTLLNAQVLVAPATAIPPSEKRVTQRLRREHVHVNYTDLPDLIPRWTTAIASVRSARLRTIASSALAPKYLVQANPEEAALPLNRPHIL